MDDNSVTPWKLRQVAFQYCGRRRGRRGLWEHCQGLQQCLPHKSICLVWCRIWPGLGTLDKGESDPPLWTLPCAPDSRSCTSNSVHLQSGYRRTVRSFHTLRSALWISCLEALHPASFPQHSHSICQCLPESTCIIHPHLVVYFSLNEYLGMGNSNSGRRVQGWMLLKLISVTILTFSELQPSRSLPYSWKLRRIQTCSLADRPYIV